jgi:hypothetical protein
MNAVWCSEVKSSQVKSLLVHSRDNYGSKRARGIVLAVKTMDSERINAVGGPS